jgi:hypothetical protein
MRCSFFLAMLALLIGASPALAQIRAADKAPYAIETAVKHRAKRAQKKLETPSYFHRSTAQPRTDKPARRRHVAKQPIAQRMEPKTAPIPLPPRAPRAKIASAEPVNADPDKAKPAPKKIEPAKTEPAKAASTKIESITPEASKAATAKPATDDAGMLAGVSASDRLKIEQELFWSGDYKSSIGGDDAMEAAIRKFQKRNKAKITGVLTDEQRAELVAAAERHQQEYGWRVVVDPATGIRIGLPTKLVPEVHDAERGTRWSSPHGAIQVETFRVKNTKLDALYEQERKKPGRTIERNTLDNNGFFVSGMQGLKYFSVHAKARYGEVRGFTMLYDQAFEGIVAPVMVAIASAFAPFPEYPAPFATLARKVEYGTGLIVSAAGHIVTAREVAHGCHVIIADGLGNAERIAEDKQNGLALLRVYGTETLPVLALPHAAPKAGDIMLIGIPDPKEQDGRKKLTELKARLTSDHAIQLHQPVPVAGFSGAAALDAQGRFLGVMETRNFVLASADPGVPPVRLVTAAAIRDFLTQHHVVLPESKGSDPRAAAIRIICVRK